MAQIRHGKYDSVAPVMIFVKLVLSLSPNTYSPLIHMYCRNQNIVVKCCFVQW